MRPRRRRKEAMKLKIDKRWQWLGVDSNGDQWLYAKKPKLTGGFWFGSTFDNAAAFTGLKPGALYRRTGEDEWEKVQ